MSKNDITGDSITTGSKNNSQLFRDNYDKIFNKMIERGVIDPATLATQYLEEQNTGKDITKIQQEQAPFSTECVAEELPKGMLEDEL